MLDLGVSQQKMECLKAEGTRRGDVPERDTLSLLYFRKKPEQKGCPHRERPLTHSLQYL